MTAECEKTSQQIILRNIELNLQTKYIEKLKHMIGTDFNALLCQNYGIDFVDLITSICGIKSMT